MKYKSRVELDRDTVVILNSKDKNFFYLKSSKRFVDTARFNLIQTESECSKKHSESLKECEFVDEAVYDPLNRGKLMLDMTDASGTPRRYLNTYVSPRVGKTIPKGSEAVVEAFRTLVTAFANENEAEAGYLIDWARSVVQKQGQLVEFVPVIISCRSLGKSLFMAVMKEMVGSWNYVEISNKLLKGRFNDYAADKTLGVIEEIKLNCQKAHNIMNDLKTMVTNDTIALEGKNDKSRNSRNFCNLIAFSNYDDCLKLEEHENRYMILKSDTARELNSFSTVNCNGEEYNLFSDVHKPLKEALDDPEQLQILRDWLGNTEISEAFKTRNRAPKTTATQELVQGWKYSQMGYEELEVYLQGKSETTMTEVVANVEILEKKSPKYIAKMLKQLGYDAIAKGHTVEYTGKRVTLYRNDEVNVDDGY